MLNEFWTRVSGAQRVFIIAEAGVNHNGDLSLAKKMIDVAKDVGCDAVKFQSFKAERMVSAAAGKAEYQKAGTAKGESHLEMIRRLELSEAMHKELFRYCRERDIIFSSSVFDEQSADFLDELLVPFFKIPSGEITNLPFLEYLAKKGRPVILSTGMSTLGEVRSAVDVLVSNNAEAVALLHCLTSYPARLEETNLRAIETLRHEFRLPVGFSDHTTGFEAAVAAVALGARIIEKHFTLDKSMPGPDHKASLEPEELREFVRTVRRIEAALGDGTKQPAECEKEIAAVARKSVVASCDIKAGTVLSEEYLCIKRPGTGLPPGEKKSLAGKIVKVDIRQDQVISREMLL